MRTFVVVLSTLIATSAIADAPVKKGFWKVLVKPNAKWVLTDTITGEDKTKKPAKLIVETYDVRKVGDADVARLRWTIEESDGTKQDHSCAGCYTQVAVNAAGLYIVDDAKDDAQIAASLKAKPSRSDPPKAYKATNKNSGRYLNVSATQVCYGEAIDPGPDGCEDICFAELCVSDKGVVQIEGLWAPNYSIFEADGFKADYSDPTIKNAKKKKKKK
jgi:hypothetical protein